MLNSLVLETYSPILVPLSFIFGVNYIEKELLLGNLNILGFLFLIISFLIYYDRVEQKNNKDFLIAGLVLFIIAYMLISYTKNWLFSTLTLLASLIFICYGITKIDFSPRSQYIYFSLFLMFIGMSFIIPYERKNLSPYNLSLISISISITILVFVTIQSPVLK